jgi:hypothetical protein
MVDFDRVKASIAAVVEALVGVRLDLRTPYGARVEAQNADGTLDVVPDSPRIPAMTRVRVIYGVPGCSAKFRRGARVVVEFLDGDQTRPIVRGWESAAVEEVTFDADTVRLADGDRPLVREGDPIVAILTPGNATTIVTGKVASGLPITGYVLKGSSKVRGF